MSGNFENVFVANYNTNPNIFKIGVSDVENPSIVASRGAGGGVQKVQYIAPWVFFGGGSGSFEIYNENDLSTLVDSINVGYWPFIVTSDLSDVYLMSASLGYRYIRKYSIFEPASPYHTAWGSPPFYAESTLIEGAGQYALSEDNNTLFVAGPLCFYLSAWDMSNWHTASVADSISVPGIRDMKVVGNYMYAVDTSGYFLIIDISTPSNIGIIGLLGLARNGEKLDINGNYAFIVDGLNLVVVDITTKTSPSILYTYTPTGLNPHSVVVGGENGEYAYFSGGVNQGIGIAQVRHQV